MRKCRGFVPGTVARLEERMVLSPGLAAEVGPSVAVTPLVRLALRGTVTGVEFRNPCDLTAHRLLLFGQGEVAPLGQVQANGTLTIGTGTIRPGGYDGQLTLAARQGDVFVHIYSTVRGPSQLPSVHLRYDITGGTRQYRGATGHGAVTYDRTPPAPGPVLPGPWRPYPQKPSRSAACTRPVMLTGYTLTLTADPSAAQASPAAERARQDLADRLGVPPEQIQLLGTERRDFPDSCLGAPEPGTFCAQVITEGYAIRLGWGGRQYEYRTPRLDNPPYLRLVQFQGRNWLIPLAFDVTPSPPRGL